MIEDGRRIKIVIDSRMINTSGIGRYVSVLIPFLLKRYQDVVLLGKEDELREKDWYDDSIQVTEFKSEIYSIREQIDYISKIPKCDIFISPHYNAPVFSFKYKKLITFFPDVNHLAFSDLSLIKKYYARLMYNLSSLRSSTIFTISDFSKSEINKYLFLKPKKLLVSKCGIDKRKLMNYQKQKRSNSIPNQPYLLYVGNVKPHKNIKRSLLAFASVCKSSEDLLFCIVGKKDGFITGDVELFDLLNTNYELKDKVLFTGYISDQELVNYYSYAKALIFPSLYEGFGLPPLEAMALKCPVITSNISSLPEICGDAAIYCNPYDIEDIAAKIHMLLSNEELVKTKIKQGLIRVKKYSWDSFSINITSEIEKLI